MMIIIGCIFFYSSNISSLYVALFVAIPLTGFILSALIQTQAQHQLCPRLHGKTILYGALPTVITTLIGLGVAMIPYCRIPIASVVAPWMAPPPAAACCAPSPSLKEIEKANPQIMAVSFGFYTFFAMMFGVVLGSGISSAC